MEKTLLSKNISSGEENYNYFTGYLNNDYNVKPLHIILPKTSANVKRYDGQTKCRWIIRKMKCHYLG